MLFNTLIKILGRPDVVSVKFFGIEQAADGSWVNVNASNEDATQKTFKKTTVTATDGKMPQRIGRLTALTALVLNNNRITGSLPESIGNLVNLTNLRLSSNNLTGSLPAGIGNLTKLTWLSLHLNAELGGSLPASFYNLVSLTDLYIYDTQIGGQLSEQIGNFSKLVNFWGYRNKFTGPLPASLGNISTLTNLYLYSNTFSGEIPSNWQNLTKLQNFWIHYNADLTGEIPSWLGSLTNLVTLAIGESTMHGTLPPSLSSLTKLTELYLWDLNLEGTIPESWQALTNLTLLQVSNNEKLSGPIPSWLANNPKLKTMPFYNCSFTQFPDVSARTDKSALAISIQNNRIPIADIERYFTASNVHPFSTFTYGPQQTGPVASPVYVPLHADLSLSAVSGGIHGVYVWEKFVNGAWTDITSTNQSTEVNKLVLPDAAAVMGGTYRYKVTNSWMPDILYQSAPIEVTITDAAVQSGKALFNGMISSVRWRTTQAYGTDGGDFTGMYVYDYDDKYQIKDASWATPNFTLNTFQLEGNRFRLTGMEYDPNGNILALKRYDKNAAPLHNFSYSYEANKTSSPT